MQSKISFHSFLFALNCWILITSWEYRLFPAHNLSYWRRLSSLLPFSCFLLAHVQRFAGGGIHVNCLMCAKVSVITNRLYNTSTV